MGECCASDPGKNFCENCGSELAVKACNVCCPNCGHNQECGQE